jgi:serine/threonine-protein kinase
MSELVGTLLSGRYRLEQRIGSGGMSTVYRAFDETLERPVAIKLLNREISDDSGQLERFRREARAVAQLSHRHIVGVIDAGEDEGRPYIVFEYVEGETLKDRIRRDGELPIDQAVAYAIEIARALGAAHKAHIVHRDVKPQNVLIDEEGNAKVTDFGIARSLDEEGLTADGRVLGTTDYVSPEQALGHGVTPQSDLYSLGVVLFEMLSGQVPFRGENQVAVAMKHVREQLPDVQMLRPEISSTLASIVDRATAKDLGRRYSDSAELISDLEGALALETARSGSASAQVTEVLRSLPSRKRRLVPLRLRLPGWAPVAIGILAVALVVLGIVLANRTHSGTGSVPEHHPRNLAPVSLAADAAHAYDPFGDHQEHSSDSDLAIDANLNTFWSTEHYSGGALGKPGIGLYVDASPGVAARALEVRDSTPGFSAAIYATIASPPSALDSGSSLQSGGWTQVAAERTFAAHTTVPLATGGRRFRFYLLWITRLAPNADTAQLNELGLLR